MNNSIKVKVPGQPIPILTKRNIETITYYLDLTDILGQTELVSGIDTIDTKLNIEYIKSRQGKYLEVRVLPSAPTSASYIDYQNTVLFKTSEDNIRAAVFSIRVHR